VTRTRGSTAVDTRARILDAAIARFRDQGFAGTSIRDLADDSGVTTAALYYHFDSKDQILRALVDPFLQTLRGITASEHQPAPEQLMEQLIDLLIEQGPVMHAVMSDVSARQVLKQSDFRDVIGNVEQVLATSDAHADLLRARCAFGALQRGVFAAANVGKRARASDTSFEQVDAADRAVILAAALAALRSQPTA
jgi:AcrR family transcriptional regulator